MKKLIRKTVLVVIVMLALNIGTGLWLQHQVTLSLETESALQGVAVDLALMMASEARMERSMTELGEDPKANLRTSMAQVIQMKALSHVQMGSLRTDAQKAWGCQAPLKNLVRDRNAAHSTSLQIVNLVKNHHENLAPLLWTKIAPPAFSHYVTETRLLFAHISRQVEKIDKSVVHRRNLQNWVQIVTLFAWAVVLSLDFKSLSKMARRLGVTVETVHRPDTGGGESARRGHGSPQPGRLLRRAGGRPPPGDRPDAVGPDLLVPGRRATSHHFLKDGQESFQTFFLELSGALLKRPGAWEVHQGAIDPL